MDEGWYDDGMMMGSLQSWREWSQKNVGRNRYKITHMNRFTAHSSDDTAGAVLAEAALVDGWVGIMVIEGEVGGDFEGIHLKAGECLDLKFAEDQKLQEL